ncbi:MAG: hypothetical protein HY670_00825, partial [Chloroflexi bacterium]|nr:hypothetical protein [Chloroflexota bacterium]
CKYSLNYETEWMTRDQIVDITYEAILRLVRLKAKCGNMPAAQAAAAERRMQEAREMAHRIDDLLARGELEVQLPRLKPEIDRINAAPVSDRVELQLPGRRGIKIARSLWSWATRL